MSNEIKMSCEKCVFAEYLDVNGKQVQYDCSLNRVKKLNPEENFESSETKSWFVSNRFCNTFRPAEWLEEFHNNNLEQAKFGVLEEVKPRLSIIIDFNEDMDLLMKNIQRIDDQEQSRKFISIINDKIEYNMEMISRLHQLNLDRKVIEYNIVMPVNRDNIYDNIDDAVKFCKNGWMVFVQKGEYVPSDLTSVIHRRVNIDLKRLVYAPKNNSQSFVIQSAIYKLLNGNKPRMMPDGSIDERTFLEKVSELKSEDPHCITTWEELFSE
jgi:hypothetical protein